MNPDDIFYNKIGSMIYHPQIIIYEQNFNDNLWISGEGKKVHITKMSNRHLDNTIAFIEREGGDCIFGLGDKWLPKLINERDERRQSR